MANRTEEASALRLMASPNGGRSLEVTNQGVTLRDRIPLKSSPEIAPELFHLLDINGLGEEQGDLHVRAGGGNETHVILIARFTAQRLLPLMGLSP